VEGGGKSHGVEKHTNKEGASAPRNAFAFTPVFFNIHRVLRVLILMRTTCRPRAPATRSRGRTRCPSSGGGTLIREHHHRMPAFRARSDGEREGDRERRLCRHGRRR
jgi:hypothetical protein